MGLEKLNNLEKDSKISIDGKEYSVIEEIKSLPGSADEVANEHLEKIEINDRTNDGDVIKEFKLIDENNDEFILQIVFPTSSISLWNLELGFSEKSLKKIESIEVL